MTPLAVKSDIYLGAHCASKLGFNTTINNLVTPRQVNSSGKGKLACEPMARIIWDCMATISKMSRSVIRHWNAPMSYESLRPLCHVDQRFLRLFELLMNKFLKSEKKKCINRHLFLHHETAKLWTLIWNTDIGFGEVTHDSHTLGDTLFETILGHPYHFKNSKSIN